MKPSDRNGIVLPICRTGFAALCVFGSLLAAAQEQHTFQPDTSGGFDWVELTSGEWLKGEITAMYDDELEFDSDKLDDLELDWEDIKQVITDRTFTVRTGDGREHSGALRIDEQQVTVTGPDGAPVVFRRAHLLSLVAGAPKEKNYWSFNLGLGLTLQGGNTQQADLNLSSTIQRRTAKSRLYLDYLGIQTVTDGSRTANNHRANTYFDIFLNQRLFVRPVFAEYYKDEFQNLKHQVTVGTGVGYHLIDNSKIEWDIFAGPGYGYSEFDSVGPGESSEVSTGAFVAGTTYTNELTDSIDFDAGYRFILMNERSGRYKHHATMGLSIELTSVLDLDLSAIWDRVQKPQQREDGTVPLQDDFRLIVGISLDI